MTILINPYRHHRFSPLELFGAGEIGGWWDPSDLSTMFQDTAGTVPVTVDTNPVGRINDKSGRGNNLLQTTAAARPQYRTAGGLHWLEFDGVDDWLTVTFTIAQPWDRISAIRQVTWLNGERMLCGVAVNTGMIYQTGVTPAISMYSGAALVLAPALSLGTNGIITEKHAGASSRVALNNGTYVTGNAGTTATDGLRIGTLSGTPASWSNIRYYGGIMRAGSMSDGQIGNIRSHFAAKAGVVF